MKQRAVENFRNNLNCAQAVLEAFSDRYHVDRSTALSISCGFGGGMGRLQETCGAVTGSFMVLGLHNCQKFNDNKQRKEVTYSMIQTFEKQFSKKNGSIKCADLLQVDLRTGEGQQQFQEKQMSHQICEKCIMDAVAIIEELTTA